MRIQVFFIKAFVKMILVTSGVISAQGATVPSVDKHRCFNFEKKLTRPPKSPSMLPRADALQISRKSGELKWGANWAVVRGQVRRPVSDLVKEISEHQTIRSKKIDELKIIPLQMPNYLIRQKVQNTVKPFPFVTVTWTDDWGFVATQGAASDPQQVTVIYEKTEGTSHIRHLCGAMVLERLTPLTTDVFLYEEADATGRSKEDTLNGLLGTLRTFRSPPAGG